MHMTPKYTFIYLQQTLIFPLKKLDGCLNDIFGWMTNNKFRLKANKTDFIIIGTSRQRSKPTRFLPKPILNHSITPSDTVRNLGVTFDSNFNFRKHVSLICRSCFYHIPDIHRIRRYISLSVARTIATPLITTRLDYCNSLLYNIASNDILKLQCIFRVVTRSPRFSHSVPFLKSLHWLPLQSRIIFKLCTIAYQTLSSGAPSYLFFMLSLAPNPRELRSYGFHFLSVPRVKTHAGTRTFQLFSLLYALEFTR